MDAGTTDPTESWFMRLGENAVRSTVMALVLTGQMLPAGAVSAQEGPTPPSVSSPDQLPPLPMPEASIPPAAPLPEKIVEEAATAEQAAAAAVQAAKDAAIRAVENASPVQPTATPEVAPLPEGTHQLADWTMIIRPGFVPAKPVAHVLDQCVLVPPPQTSVSVPVTVNVHNNVSPHQFPWMWSVPATYPTQWNAPTSAYLFQRPRPYWKLRGDFHHLAPFIPGYWY